MLKNVSPVFCLLAMAFTSCNNNQPAGTATAPEKNYFPVVAYINTELNRMDSLQLPLVRYESASGKTDTLPVTTAEARALAAPFLEQDITDPALRDRYQESSFADQSIPSINFTYLTADSSLPLKRVDVVLKPDPEKTDKVLSLYMDRLFQQGDTVVNEKLFWKADNYYQVIRSRQVPGDSVIRVSQTKVLWDATE